MSAKKRPNLISDFWGPPAWFFIHSTAFGYPDKPTQLEKDRFRSFYSTLAIVLPCENCRDHYQEILADKYPLTDDVLKNRNNLIKWTYDIHRYINRYKNIPSPSYNSFYTFYNSKISNI